MSVENKSRVFEGLDPVNEAGIDDWKMDKVVEAVGGYLIDLSGRWDLSLEDVGGSVEVRVVDDRGSIDGSGVQLSDPDLYRAVMRSNYDSPRVHDAVDRHYPVQFHQVPEEVGQLLGERANESWEFEDDFGSIARDELHGDLAKMEYFPWFLSHERGVWKKDLAALGEMNDEEQLDYLQEVQRELEEEGWSDPYAIAEKAEEMAQQVPDSEFLKAYNTKYGDKPQPLSRAVIDAYVTEPGYREEGGDTANYGEFQDGILEFLSFSEDELREIRDGSLRHDSRTDRAYLAAARIADEVADEPGIDPQEIVKGDEKTGRYINRRLHEEDRKIRSRMGLN